MIDANGTRHHLLLGAADWGFAAPGAPRASDVSVSDRSAPDATLAWNTVCGELTLRPRLERHIAARGDRPVQPKQRRGAARDRFGNWYWLDGEERAILVRGRGRSPTSVFWPLPVAAPSTSVNGAFGASPGSPAAPQRTLRGLATTRDHHLIVGSVQPSPTGTLRTSLLVFDLYGGGEPFEVAWPDVLPLDLWDLSAAPDGSVWVLDRERQRYWGLDRQLRIRRRQQGAPAAGGFAATMDDVTPSDGVEQRAPSREDAFPAPALVPISIEALGNDQIALLDYGRLEDEGNDSDERGDSTVIVLEHTQQDGSWQPVERARVALARVFPPSAGGEVTAEDPADAAFRGHDLAFVPASAGPSAGDLYVATSGGNQALRFSLREEAAALRLELRTDFLPLRLFGGRGVVAAAGGVHYDSGDNWVPLTAQRRQRFEEHGVLLSKIFDGKQPGCVWHRLTLDARLPSGTRVSVWSRAADAEQDLESRPWLPEPQPDAGSVPAGSAAPALRYRRRSGSEIPFLEPPDQPDEGTWELLFQRASGRYLQLRFELSGDGVRTPSLRALRVWYPRFSYRDRYLPRVYREADAGGFLERFLANFEGSFTALEDRVAAAQLLFDVRSTPRESLDWLASWFGVLFDPAWNESRRRLFLRNVMSFFQWRGTLRGLKTAVALATLDCVDERLFEEHSEQQDPFGIRVVEHFRARHYPLAVLEGTAAAGTGLLAVRFAERWRTSDGVGALLRRYREFVKVLLALEQLPELDTFPTRRPSLYPELWQAFLERELGLPDLAQGVDEPGWRTYLERRYLDVAALNAAHDSSLVSFADAQYPDPLPAHTTVLEDWYRYESAVRAMRRTAHRFTLLLPVPPGTAGDALRQKLQLAARVTAIEKPAHTSFDVKAYWAMFQLGRGRLGHDSRIDGSDLALALLPPAIVGQAHLAEAFTAWGPAHGAPDRWVAGHRVLGQRSSQETSR